MAASPGKFFLGNWLGFEIFCAVSCLGDDLYNRLN